MKRPVLAAVTATTTLVVLAAAPARAADDDIIGLSPDGVRWSGTLAEPLFDPAARWVPGDVRTARFFIRNQQPDDGDLTVDLLQSAVSELRDTGWLDISTRAGGGPWRAVAQTGVQRLLTRDDFAPDSPLSVELRVAMRPEAPNDTMVLSTDLDLRITLTDSEVVADGAGSVGDPPGSPSGVIVLPGGGIAAPGADTVVDDGVVLDSSGGRPRDEALPDTAWTTGLPAAGTSVESWLPPLGLLLLGTGAFLVARRRYEHELVEEVLSNGASPLENRLNDAP